jgi:ABC-type proline/glycine betaine transport system permease subunit
MEEPLLDNENSDIQQMFFETNHKLIKIKRNIFFGFWLVMIPVLIVVVFFVIKYGMGHPYLSEVQSLNYVVLTNSGIWRIHSKSLALITFFRN